MQKDRAHVGLQIHARKIECKRTDALRRCRANAGQRDQIVRLTRKLPIPVLHNALCSPVKRQGAAIVAHPLPRIQDIGRGGLSKRPDSRKAIEPRRHARLHARHLRLLQHDLGKPDDIRVTRAAPRKVAITQDPFRTNHRTKGVLNHDNAPYAALFLPASIRASGVLGKRIAVGELGIDSRKLAMGDDIAERNGIEIVAHQRLGSGPQGMIAARAHARTVAIGRGAIVHNHGALNGLYDLTDRDIVGAYLKAHAAMNTTQALHNAGLNQAMLNRTGKRIRNIDLFGSSANRKQPLRLLGKHRKHAKGIISLPRYVHVSPFKEYEQLERAPGPSLCRDAK